MSVTYTSGMNHDDLETTLRYLQGDKRFVCRTNKQTGQQTWEWDDDSTPPTVAELTAAKSAAIAAREWKEVRRKRDMELRLCDWTQAADSPLTDAKKTEWATYRQALRDVGSQADPLNITWPTEPS